MVDVVELDDLLKSLPTQTIMCFYERERFLMRYKLEWDLVEASLLMSKTPKQKEQGEVLLWEFSWLYLLWISKGINAFTDSKQQFH